MKTWLAKLGAGLLCITVAIFAYPTMPILGIYLACMAANMITLHIDEE
jgi:hypothetical protein